MAYRTTTIDTYCSYVGDACLGGTIAVTIASLTLTDGHTFTLTVYQTANSARVGAAASVTCTSGTVTASVSLDDTDMEAALGARKEIPCQMYLWDTTSNVMAWNGPLRVRWAPEP